MNYLKNRFGIYLLIIISLLSNNIMLANTKPYYNVLEYGATADGKTLDTKAIQDAIDECANNGGGTVEFPAGTYLSGTIILKDNVILNLQAGSKILGSKNIKDYPMHIPQIPNNMDMDVYRALIYGENLKNIGITGFGVIDGQGKKFHLNKVTEEGLEEIKKLYKDKTRYIPKLNSDDRPVLLRLVSCKDVRVEGITLQYPAKWTQHYLNCDGVIVRDMKVFAHGGVNNDMIDIDGCRNVIITGMIGDSDDDAICLKSIGEQIVENVIISDCIIRTRTNGIKTGTDSYGGFRDITITNCYIGPSQTDGGFSGYDEGFAGIALELVDGGILENITISNLAIEDMAAPIFIRLGNRDRTFKPNMGTRPIGVLNNISISDIVARNAGKTGCSIIGEIDHPIKNISISNVRINFDGGGTLVEALAEKPELVNEYPECTKLGILPAYGFFVRHVDGITFRDVELTYNDEEHRPAMVFNDVKKLKLLNFNAEIANDALGQLVLQNTRDVFINGCSPTSSNLFLRLEQNCKNVNVTGNNFSGINNSIFIDETISTNDLNVSSNLTGKSTLFEMLQPNIKRDSLGMVTIYYPNNADVYYTTDGTNPTKSSKKYLKAFEQISPVVIKAKAFKNKNTSGTAILELKRLNVLAPRIFPAYQFFNEKIVVKLTSNTKGADIYYTTNGTTPDKTSLKYKRPITIQAKTNIRAIAIKDGLVPSNESVSKYEPIEKLEGVQYKYYEGRWVEVPNFLNLTPKKVGVVNMFKLDNLEHRDLNFGLVMHGYLDIKKEGDYTFFAATNDGSRLLVDNIEIINNDGEHVTIEKSGIVYLDKGKHLIELRYFQSGGGKDIKISWSGPDFEKQEINQNVLSR